MLNHHDKEKSEMEVAEVGMNSTDHLLTYTTTGIHRDWECRRNRLD